MVDGCAWAVLAAMLWMPRTNKQSDTGITRRKNRTIGLTMVLFLQTKLSKLV
jgi:phage terminase large subunit-like protein